MEEGSQHGGGNTGPNVGISLSRCIAIANCEICSFHGIDLAIKVNSGYLIKHFRAVEAWVSNLVVLKGSVVNGQFHLGGASF